MKQKGGKLFTINPKFIPLSFLSIQIPEAVVRMLMIIFKPFLMSKRFHARLRMLEFRGKLSAAMIYDKIAIIDNFRKVDDNTLLGVMDIKNYPDDRMYFFLLERE